MRFNIPQILSRIYFYFFDDEKFSWSKQYLILRSLNAKIVHHDEFEHLLDVWESIQERLLRNSFTNNVFPESESNSGEQRSKYLLLLFSWFMAKRFFAMRSNVFSCNCFFERILFFLNIFLLIE